MKRLCLQFGAVLLAFLLFGGTAAAQAISSGAQTISLNALVGEGIMMSVSTNTVNFSLAPGRASNPGSTGVTVTTSWNTRPGRDLHIFAFFASSAAALSNGLGNNIPSLAFSISANGGAFLPLTNTLAYPGGPYGGAGAGLEIGVPTKITGTSKKGTRVDNLLFNLDLSTLALPAGTYTGILTLRAQAI